MKYFKMTLNSKVVGMGYLDENSTNNMLFQMFEEVDYYETEEIEIEEFKELGRKYNFEGMKPVVLPTAYFNVSLN